jgi:hypothetical protein
MLRYLFCVTEVHPPAELPVTESGADPREREAARLEVVPAGPGEDPPTCGDEGGGNLHPKRSVDALREAPQPGLLRRLARLLLSR